MPPEKNVLGLGVLERVLSLGEKAGGALAHIEGPRPMQGVQETGTEGTVQTNQEHAATSAAPSIHPLSRLQ